jgi:hypothetical protein
MSYPAKGIFCIFAAILVSAMFNSCGGSSSSSSILSVLTQTQTSTYYTYHFSPGDSVDAAFNDAFYAWDSAQLGVKLSAKIQYYKFTDVSQKQKLTGISGNAYSDPATFSVYTIWPIDNHETTHVLTAVIGTPTPFFNEGMAVANQTDPLDGIYTPDWNGHSPHYWAKQYLQQGTLPALSSILDESSFEAMDPSTSYPIAGSFVRYLIDTTSLAAVLKMFAGASYNDPAATTEARFQQVFGAQLTTLEQNWHAFLLQYKGG